MMNSDQILTPWRPVALVVLVAAAVVAAVVVGVVAPVGAAPISLMTISN
ncbi:hypothetical protein [Litchfieldella anticariensis]|nr:hypothetical protein [Halomonas anticariensis]